MHRSDTQTLLNSGVVTILILSCVVIASFIAGGVEARRNERRAQQEETGNRDGRSEGLEKSLESHARRLLEAEGRVAERAREQ
jgi:hypothetical protein